MAKTKTELLADLASRQPDNTTQLIAPADTREPSVDIVNSVPTLLDNRDLLNTQVYSVSRSEGYITGETCIYNDGGGDKLYKANKDTAGTFTPADWDVVGVDSGETLALGVNQNGLTLTGTTAKILELLIASTSQTGALSNTDWNTFNQKQAALGFTPEDSNQRGVPDGYAPLNSSGKLDSSFLDAGLTGSVIYKGFWSAATNTPTLVDGDYQGDYYVCNAAGSVDFGSGLITFAAGDWVINNGTIWQRLENSTDGITSVQGLAGPAVDLGTGVLDELVAWTGANTFKTTGLKFDPETKKISVSGADGNTYSITIGDNGTGFDHIDAGALKGLALITNTAAAMSFLYSTGTSQGSISMEFPVTFKKQTGTKYSIALSASDSTTAQVKFDSSGASFAPSGGADDGSFWASSAGLFYRHNGVTIDLLSGTGTVDASAVTFDPSGSDLTATNVEAALKELDTEKAKRNGDANSIYSEGESLVYAATVNLDLSSRDNFDLSGEITGSTNITATNIPAKSGQVIKFTFKQNVTGGNTVSFSSDFIEMNQSAGVDSSSNALNIVTISVENIAPAGPADYKLIYSITSASV